MSTQTANESALRCNELEGKILVTIHTHQSKSRLSFPFREPEQWWEIWHNTERSLAALFAMMPVSAVSRRLLGDPNIKTNKKALEVVTYEYLENVFTRTTGAQIIRSWTTLYGSDRKFQRCIHAGELLAGLTASAAFYDRAPLALAEEIKNGHVTPIHDFIFHSHDANQMISDFVTGEMEVTPTNLRLFEQHMQAMAELSAQPLAFAQEMRRHSVEGQTPHTRPGDYIREVLHTKQLENPRQLQILFSLLPPLITHGALALSHVEYVPQEKRFLSVEQSVKLAKAVDETLAHRGYEFNFDERGFPLVEGVSSHAIVKKTKAGYEPVSEEELLKLGNRLLQKTRRIAGSNINRILAYADEHYEAVEQQLLDSVYPSKPKENKLSTTTAFVSSDLIMPWFGSDKTSPVSHKTDRWTSYIGAVWNNVTRDESKHEMTKLYRRKLPIQMTKMPINVIGDYLLRGGSKDIRSIQAGDWQPIAKKELWALAANPIAGAHGLVSIREIVGTGTQLTDASIKKLNRHFSAAVEAGLAMDERIQESLSQSRSAMYQKRLAIPPALRAEVERVQQKDPRFYTPEDYATLQSYFSALSQTVNHHTENLLKPYAKQEGETLADMINRNVLEPVGDVPSALMTLSFIHSVLQKEVKNLHSLEFVDPKKNLLPVKSFRRIADYMEEQLTAAGIAMVGEEYRGKICSPEGFVKGQIVTYNRESQRYEEIEPETIIRLANVLAAKFRRELGSNNQLVAEGKVDKTHYAFVEKALFVDRSQKKNTSGIAVFSDATPWLTFAKPKQERNVIEKVGAAWKHATRAEALHEAKLLWSRTTYARFTGIPISIWQNIRRGYIPVDKETGHWKVDPDASIMEIFTNPGRFISKGSMLSQLWGAVAYPIGEFVSTIGREMGRYKVADTIADTSQASDTLGKLMQQLPKLSANWEVEYSEHTGKSAAIDHEISKMVPRIAMKPAHLRVEHENELMQQYMKEAGTVILATTSRLMMNATGRQISKHCLLEQPVINLAEAHETLAQIKAIMDASRQHLGVLRFVDPKRIIIDGKGLAHISEVIETQYSAANKGGSLHTEKGIIRLANVIRDQFLAVADIEKLEAHSSAVSSKSAAR